MIIDVNFKFTTFFPLKIILKSLSSHEVYKTLIKSETLS